MEKSPKDRLTAFDGVDSVTEAMAGGEETYHVQLDSDGLTLDEYEKTLRLFEKAGFEFVEGLGPPSNRPISSEEDPAYIHVRRVEVHDD